MGDGYIYKITNTVDSLLYIGVTGEIRIRWAQHKNAARTGSHLPLYVAMRTYGIEKFSIEVMEKCENNKTMYDRELELMRLFNTIHPYGYNVRALKLTDEQAAIVKYNYYHLHKADYAEMFGISTALISLLRSKFNWNPYKHVTRDHLPSEGK